MVLNQSEWVVPSVLMAGDGLDLLNGRVLRGVRFRVVFDQDAIGALIGTAPGAYFRVTDFEFDYTGD